MGISGTGDSSKEIYERRGLSENHCRRVAFLHGICLPNWKLSVFKQVIVVLELCWNDSKNIVLKPS